MFSGFRILGFRVLGFTITAFISGMAIGLMLVTDPPMATHEPPSNAGAKNQYRIVPIDSLQNHGTGYLKQTSESTW